MTEVDRDGYRPASGVPARGYAWEPFQPGHTVSMRHGAFSPRRVEPRAAELVEQVLADPGTAYLQASRWRAAVWAWARAETRVELITEWLADNGGGIDEEGNVAGALNQLLKWEARAAGARDRLGLSPLAAARLGRDVGAAAVDMAKLLSGLADDAGEQQKPAESHGDSRTGPDAGSGVGDVEE